MHIEDAQEDAHLDGLAAEDFRLIDLLHEHHLAIADGRDFIRRRIERTRRNAEEPQDQQTEREQDDAHTPLDQLRHRGNEMHRHHDEKSDQVEDGDDLVSGTVDVHGAKIRKPATGWPPKGQK